MKRPTILGIILACFAVLCLGQARSRVVTQRIIQLTDPDLEGTVSFESALAKQKSVLRFSTQPLQRTHISQLAWAGQGNRGQQAGMQTAPATGVMFPIQLLFATQDGVFVYQPAEHSLEQTQAQDIRGALAAATSMPEPVASAGCNIIITSPIRKLAAQNGNQARTNMFLEAGHVAQNIQLQAVCLGLGSVTVNEFNTREVRRITRLLRDLDPLYIVCVGYPAGQTTRDGQGQEGTTIKRAALIVPAEKFQDQEFFTTMAALNEAAIQSVVASTRIGRINGVLGRSFDVSIMANQLRVDDYDAIIFIGGPGAFVYFNDPVALSIVRDAVLKRKIVAATSIAPSILASAGVLSGRRVTADISQRDGLVLIGGARYTGVPVERDGNIITCSGPAAAVSFATAVVDAITGK